MSFRKFLLLLSGLKSDSALGRVVELRGTSDKNLSPELKKLKNRVALRSDVNTGISALFTMV